MHQLVTEIIDEEPYRYYPLGDYVVRAPDICGGHPTFKHTRIEISGALDRIAAGETIDQIVDGYRGRVPREAVVEAVQLVTHKFIDSLPELKAA